MTATATVPATAPDAPAILPTVTMHAAVARDDLARALAIACKIAPRRARLPILGMVHVETVAPDAATGRPSGIRISATDLQTAYDQIIPAASGWSGAATIPAHDLAALVKSAPRGATVDLTARKLGAAYMVDVIAGGPAASFVGADPIEYPTGAHTMDGALFVGSIGAQNLRAAFGRVTYAAATDQYRDILRAVAITINGYDAELACADNYRLAITNASMIESDAPVRAAHADRLQITPSAVACDLVAGAIGARGTGRVAIWRHGPRDLVAFVLDNGVRIIARAATGPFPRYDQIIPADADADLVAVANAGALVAALKAAGPVARATGGSVIVTLSRDGIAIGAGTNGANGAATGASFAMTVPATVSGPDADDGMRIGFNAAYLADAVAQIAPDDTAIIRTAGPNTPARVTAGRAPYPGPLGVIMPIRLAR